MARIGETHLAPIPSASTSLDIDRLVAETDRRLEVWRMRTSNRSVAHPLWPTNGSQFHELLATRARVARDPVVLPVRCGLAHHHVDWPTSTDSSLSVIYRPFGVGDPIPPSG
jgi:hypothetical protein